MAAIYPERGDRFQSREGQKDALKAVFTQNARDYSKF
jgi:hypothetical protein